VLGQSFFEQRQVMYALAAADQFAVAFAGQHIDAQHDFGRSGSARSRTL